VVWAGEAVARKRKRVVVKMVASIFAVLPGNECVAVRGKRRGGRWVEGALAVVLDGLRCVDGLVSPPSFGRMC
jgi:hypothetical protein